MLARRLCRALVQRDAFIVTPANIQENTVVTISLHEVSRRSMSNGAAAVQANSKILSPELDLAFQWLFEQ